MRQDFNYNSVPQTFLHCFNGQCKHADNCLRFQVTLHIPNKCEYITIVNPARTTPNAESCPHFKPDQMQQFALGMTHMLDNIPHNDAIIIKQQIIAYMNKTTYYRCWRKERLIKPCEQEQIRQIFHNRGVTDEPLFDEYIEQYNW